MVLLNCVYDVHSYDLDMSSRSLKENQPFVFVFLCKVHTLIAIFKYLKTPYCCMSICDKWHCDCQRGKVSIFKIQFSKLTFSIPVSNILLFWQITVLKQNTNHAFIWLSWRIKHQKDEMLRLSFFIKTSCCDF